MKYTALILVVLVQGIQCQNCTRTNTKKDFCVTSCTQTQSNCSGNTTCVCDGDCGYSCVKQDLQCQGLRNIDHGIVRFKDTTLGSIARYKCSERYTLQGPRRRVCRGNGEWDGSEPVCKIVCGDPGDIQHGTRNHKGFERGKRVKYKCSPGFTMQGRGTLICRRSGQWDRKKPDCTCARTNTKSFRYCQSACDPNRNKCKGNRQCICDGDCGYSCVPKGSRCGKPIEIQNGKRQFSSTAFLSTVKYQCNKPYSLLGSSMRTCRGIREWDGITPQCKILCQEPGDTEHATKQIYRNRGEDNITVGARVEYTCFPGYKMEGVNLITCDKRGQWDHEKPNCILPSCDRPEIPANAELWQPKKIKASYRFGEKIMFRCKVGYFSRGIGIQTCDLTGWVRQSFSCSPKSCGNPGIPTNGEIKSYIFTFKSRVYFDCKYGYKLVGDRYRQCQSNQRWSGRIPTCQEIDCGVLQTPVMATKVLETGTKVDGVVRYACKEKGYEISGSEMRTCLSTGVWSGFTTSCKIISCGDPGTPVNGKQVNMKNDYNYGGSVEFACNDNHTLAGSTKIKCEESKDWSAPVPRCFAPCSEPGIPGNGSRTGDNFLHSSSVSFTCDQGFDLQGEKSITCTDGTWSNTRPRCKVVSCEDPGTPLHGYKRKVSGNYTYGGFIRFKCKTNYTLKGRSKLTCQANKKWTYDKPTCLAPCPDPGQLLNGRIIGDSFTHGSVLRFECLGDYVLEGATTMRCNEEAWSTAMPACAAPCPASDQLLHGRIIGDNFQHGSVVRFECLDDHLLQGSPVRKCDDGEWSTTMPTCAACDSGFPLGMSSGAIPDSSIRASSQTDQHPAHHGRLGGNKYWCSRKERMSELRIDLSKKYKITALTIEVQDPKDISFIALLGSILQTWFQFDAQKPAFRSRRSKIAITFPFISESLKILVRRKESTVCLRAEVYGCDIPRDCIVRGSPVFASNDGNDGTFFKGYVTAKAGYQLEFLNQESKEISRLPMERIFLNKKPEPMKLSNGTFVLVKDSRSNQVRKGEILLVKYPLYSVKIEGIGDKINAHDIDILAVVRQAKFCSS